MTNSLQKEIDTYRAKKAEMLREHANKWVLIKGDVIEGFYESYEVALRTGYERHKLTGFLVKQILLIDPVLHAIRRIA